MPSTTALRLSPVKALGREGPLAPLLFLFYILLERRRERQWWEINIIRWPHKQGLLLSKEGHSSQVARQFKITWQVFLGHHTSFSLLLPSGPTTEFSSCLLPFLPPSSGNNWAVEGSPPAWKPPEGRVLSI